MSRISSRLLVVAAGALLSSAAMAAGNVSVSVNQPGFYGRVDLGDQPPPAVIYAEPVVIAPRPVYVQQRPIYMRVPPGHYKNWGRYCGMYQACNQPVYFVREEVHYHHDHDRDDWDDHRHGHGHGHGHGKGHGRGHGHGHD